MDFSAFNAYFDHIYVITLHRAQQRHEKIKQGLRGLDYSFLYGADNKDFSLEELKAKGIYDEAKAKKLHRYGKPMGRGILGCALSHRMVYKDVIKNNYTRVLIFEDDIVPFEEGLQNFAAILQELPADWGMLYFDYNKYAYYPWWGFLKQGLYHIKRKLGDLTFTQQIINNLYARPFSKHLKTAGYHDFGSAYAITNDTARKLIELQTPVAFRTDSLLAYASANKLVKAFITIPKLFIQESQLNKKVVGSYVEEV